MRNRYDHYLHQKTNFLPMLCSKPSIKDVTVPQPESRSATTTTTTAAALDPLSPKVGCMGQVKRNNRITTFLPSQTLTITTKLHNNVAYFKLNKLFSSKNLIATTTTTTTTTTATAGAVVTRTAKISSCRRQRSMIRDAIEIGDMDPPLPVMKKVRKPMDEGGDGDSLWKRRSGGVELRTLQVEQIHLPKHHLQPTTV